MTNPTPPRDRLAEIERALEPFHAHDDFIDDAPNTAVVSITVTVGDLRAASAALTTLAEMRADMVGLAELSARATPGEWTIEGDRGDARGAWVQDPSGEYVLMVCRREEGRLVEVANADLIARSVNIIRKWLGSAA